MFFCCHKCHTEGKFGRKGGENKVGSATKRKEENRVFQGCGTGILRLYIDRPLKSVQRNRITTCFQAIYKQTCDTCDSKNTKTPVCMRVRVRAIREDYRYFHIPFFRLLLSPLPSVEKNDTSVSTKRHVGFNKTTRRFQQNNVSFLGRKVVMDKGEWRKNQRRRRRFSFIRCVKSCK